MNSYYKDFEYSLKEINKIIFVKRLHAWKQNFLQRNLANDYFSIFWRLLRNDIFDNS